MVASLRGCSSRPAKTRRIADSERGRGLERSWRRRGHRARPQNPLRSCLVMSLESDWYHRSFYSKYSINAGTLKLGIIKYFYTPIHCSQINALLNIHFQIFFLFFPWSYPLFLRQNVTKLRFSAFPNFFNFPVTYRLRK